MEGSGSMTAERKGRWTRILRWQHAAIFLASCAVIISRRPDAIFRAQFYAEDGRIFYADANHIGAWHACFHTYAGYFQILTRLSAVLAMLVPLASAPLLMNILAVWLQALPVTLLLSARSSAWGSLRFRALMAASYLALPDNAQITYGINLAQWPLALGMFLLLAASAPQGTTGRIFDCVFLLLAGLTGPFSILILPVAAYSAWKRKEGWRWVQCALTAGCAVVQLWALLILDSKGRPHYPVGYDAAIFTRILGGNVFLDTLMGRVAFATLPGTGSFLFLLCAAVGGVAIVTVCFFKSRMEMRLFLAFACIVFACSLISPTTNRPDGTTMWKLLLVSAGIRYWFFPSLAFAWTLLWCARSGNAMLQAASALLFIVMALGVIMGWKNPAYKDFRFAEYAKAFEAAPPGTDMAIPENPDGWYLELVKHASR